MPVHVGHFRMPWWLWPTVPVMIWGMVDMAWEAAQPGGIHEPIAATRRTAGVGQLLDNIPAPLLAALLAAFAVLLLVGFLLMAYATLLRKPCFKLDSRGVAAFSVLDTRTWFIAWRDIQRVQVVEKLAVLHGRPGTNGKPTKINISLGDKRDKAALTSALAHFRPDLWG